MKNKASLLIVIMVGLAALLACKQLGLDGQKKSSNEIPKAADTESRTFTLAGKEWSSYDLPEMDVKIDMPGKPSDKSPPLPENAKEIFSAMRVRAYDEKDFSVGATMLAPTGKRKFTIKELADTSMAAVKKQLPNLTYTLDVTSDTNAKYNGSFTKNGKTYDLRGCCIFKKSKPERVWAIITFYPNDNADGKTAGRRVIDSVVFTGSDEVCK